MGRIRNVQEDVNRELTYKLLISRSSVRSRDGPPLPLEATGCNRLLPSEFLERNPFSILGCILRSVLTFSGVMGEVRN